MLPCNNTGFTRVCLIKAQPPPAPQKPMEIGPDPMSAAEDLARRWLALWGDYLTGLAADPQAAELIRRSLAPAASRDDDAGSSPRTAAAPGAPGGGGDAVGELARRIDELESRLAAVEQRSRKPAASTDRGNRTRRKK